MEKYPKKVTLKDDEIITLRLLNDTDLEILVSFFQSLPEKDRMYLRSDVMNRENIVRRFGKINYDQMYPVLALSKQAIIAIGTLFRAGFGWMRNLGEVRCVVSPPYQRKGLCSILVREIFLHAVTTDLYKLQAEIMEDQVSAVHAFQRMGFKKETVLHKHVTDIHGQRSNLVIMSLDIEELWCLLEDFTHGKTYVV